MNRRTSTLLPLACLGLALSGCGERQKRTKDTGEVPDCTDGWLADRGECVPEACGTGSWGDLPVDASTVHVDASAPDDGDGSAEAPLRSIQPALDLAGSRGGGLVAVAAGTYAETLEFTTDHAGVHLAGRCRELVILDASVGDEGTSGIGIDTWHSEAEVSGLGVVGASFVGVLVGSGEVRLVDLSVEGSGYTGITAYRASTMAPAILEVEGCALVRNAVTGVMAIEPGTEVVLLDTTIRDTLVSGDVAHGLGIDVYGGATLTAERCEVVGSTVGGVVAFDPGTVVALVDTTVRGTFPDGDGEYGYGINAHSGAALTAEGCELVGNTGQGVLAGDRSTSVVLVDTRIQATMPNGHGEYGNGIRVRGGASVTARGCELAGNAAVGVAVIESGSAVELVDTRVLDTVRDGNGEGGLGLGVHSGAVLTAEGCELAGNSTTGLVACGSGASVSLVDTRIRDTLPDMNGDLGLGIDVYGGAALSAEGCELDGNAAAGVMAGDTGTVVSLVDTRILDTLPDGNGEFGLGIQVNGGATLTAEGCELAGNTGVGVGIIDAGTVVSLVDTVVRDTQPHAGGESGYGIQVESGAMLTVEGCELAGNVVVGLLAYDPGTQVELRDSSIRTTSTGSSTTRGTTACGLVAQEGASVVASGLRAQDNEGPGLYSVNEGTTLSCTDCSLLGNAFAGAVVIHGGDMEIHSSTISGTGEGADLGGGVGIYAAEQWNLGPPSLVVTDTVVTDHQVAGTWFAGEGSYQLTGNSISGGSGVPHGATTRCGDGVYAAGTTAWDGGSGLALEGNAFTENAGAGLFLDAAAASLDGNTWAHNAPDLLVQGETCQAPCEDWSEAPSSEICPTWERPTCELAFQLNLDVADIDQAMAPLPPVPIRSLHEPLPVLAERQGGLGWSH